MLRPLVLLLAATLPFVVHAVAPPRVVLIFGDSITAGGALPKNQQSQLWVKLVESRSAGALNLVNEGKGGRPTNSVAEFDAMLHRRPQAAALVIALGMNDSRDISEACVPNAVANLRTMIQKARASYGEKLPVLLVGPTNINKSALGPTKPIADQREAKLRELGDAFARLAAEAGCEFVSLFGVVPADSLLKDGVHPDAAGNVAIAQAIEARIHALVRR